jgi:hypothetical protein
VRLNNYPFGAGGDDGGGGGWLRHFRLGRGGADDPCSSYCGAGVAVTAHATCAATTLAARTRTGGDCRTHRRSDAKAPSSDGRWRDDGEAALHECREGPA